MKLIICGVIAIATIASRAEASGFSACLKKLVKLGISDAAKTLDVYALVPEKLHIDPINLNDLSQPERERLGKISQFYQKYAYRVALPLSLAAIVGYVVKEFPGFHFIGMDHYSSSVLFVSILNAWYSTTAAKYPVDRIRLLAKMLVFSAGLHFFWEVGPIHSPWERIIPQSPRSGTDFGDLSAGLVSTALYGGVAYMVEAINSKRFRLHSARPSSKDLTY